MLSKLEKCNTDHKKNICVYNSKTRYLGKCFNCNKYNNYIPLRGRMEVFESPVIHINQSDERILRQDW